MKKITLVTLIMAGVIYSCKPKSEEAPKVDKTQIKNEIQGIENKMSGLYSDNAIDGEDYYADDAISFSQNRPKLVGKRDIEKSIKEDIANFTKGHKITFITEEVFPSADGNQVTEIGSYKVRDSTDVICGSGYFISLFEKREGKYVCIRDMAASEMPKPGKPEEKK